jgi:predicted dehydrogenase
VKTPIGIGIIGAGNIAELNVAGYRYHPDARVVAVCDRNLERAQQAAARWGAERACSELAELLSDPSVDAVEILTPTYLHHAHALEAIRAGKHVSIQKPIANTVRQAVEMVEEAARAGVVLRVSECAFFYPPLVRAKRLIAEGAIGTPTFVRIHTVVGRTESAFQAGLDPSGYTWRFDHRSPGGHLFDDMIHKYGIALWLFEEPIERVHAVVRQGPLFFETPTVALFEYGRRDLLGSLDVQYAPEMLVRSAYYGADEFIEVQGTSGFVWVTRMTGQLHDLPALVVYRGDGTSTSYAGLDTDWAAGFRGAAAHFVEALRDGRPDPEMTGPQAIDALRVCFAVYRSSNEGRPVAPREIDDAVSPPWWPLVRR